jgi:hypothetical protein
LYGRAIHFIFSLQNAATTNHRHGGCVGCEPDPVHPESVRDRGTGNQGSQGKSRGLATIGLPTDNPLEALTKLKHITGNTFRRIRDDKSLAEEITFELGPDGEVLRMKQLSNLF